MLVGFILFLGFWHFFSEVPQGKVASLPIFLKDESGSGKFKVEFFCDLR